MDWAQAVPPASLRWAQDAAGARVVAALPLDSQWLANHLLVLADGRELVLRRWARPGWEVDDPDLTAAREALVLERLADTPGAGARAGRRRPRRGGVRRPGAAHHARAGGRRSPGARRSGRSSRALAEIHAVDPDGIPPYRRYYEPERLAVPTWAADRERVGARHRAGPRAAARCCPSASSTATSTPATRCGRARSSPGVVDWTTGSRGPGAVDLGHLRWNLVVDYGQRVADALLPHPEHHPYYDVVTALDVLPDLDPTTPHAELLRLEDARRPRRVGASPL